MLKSFLRSLTRKLWSPAGLVIAMAVIVFLLPSTASAQVGPGCCQIPSGGCQSLSAEVCMLAGGNWNGILSCRSDGTCGEAEIPAGTGCCVWSDKTKYCQDDLTSTSCQLPDVLVTGVRCNSATDSRVAECKTHGPSSSTTPAAGTSSTPKTTLTFTPEVELPGVFSGAQKIDNNLAGRYIRAVYVYFVWAVGILAVFMMIYGGVKWVVAAGNTARIADARGIINNAIIGVIIALTSYLLLSIIDPRFVTLGLPPVGSVNGTPLVQAEKVCDVDYDRGRQDDPKVNPYCGDLFTYETKDSTGKTVTNNCLGIRCRAKQVCQITSYVNPADNKTYYQTGGGCIKDVPIEPLSGDKYDGVTSIPVASAEFASWTVSNDCTKIGLEESFRPGWLYTLKYFKVNKRVGWVCLKAGQDPVQPPASFCYMVGPKVKVINRTGLFDFDDVEKIYCGKKAK